MAEESLTGPRQILQIVEQTLAELGLVVEEDEDPPGALAHLYVTSPTAPELGTISIGWDGYVIWERWGPAENVVSADAIVSIVAGVMRVDSRSALPAHGPAVPR